MIIKVLLKTVNLKNANKKGQQPTIPNIKGSFQVTQCPKTINMNFQKQRTTLENKRELPIPLEGSQTSESQPM